MKRFEAFSGLAVPLMQGDVDTDQIIPKQFLKRVERTGFGQYLFYDWRFDTDGKPRADFVLNLPRYGGARILVAGANFGCGSSREHAPWALQDYGLCAIIAPSFADIFLNNCFKNGLLPVQLPPDQVAAWVQRIEAQVGYTIAVDLEAQTLTGSDGFVTRFEIDPFHKRCLLEGLDDIALTLEHKDAIAAYEVAHTQPWQAAVSKAP